MLCWEFSHYRVSFLCNFSVFFLLSPILALARVGDCSLLFFPCFFSYFFLFSLAVLPLHSCWGDHLSPFDFVVLMLRFHFILPSTSMIFTDPFPIYFNCFISPPNMPSISACTNQHCDFLQFMGKVRRALGFLVARVFRPPPFLSFPSLALLIFIRFVV